MVGDENVPVIKTWVSAFTQALAGLGCIDGRKTLMGGACAEAYGWSPKKA